MCIRDSHRLANLLQVSSAFGRVMESIDYVGLVNAVYPTLLAAKKNNSLSTEQLNNVVAACTDGYPFPTNLNTDLASGGLAPKTQRQCVIEALDSSKDHATLAKELNDQLQRRFDLAKA